MGGIMAPISRERKMSPAKGAHDKIVAGWMLGQWVARPSAATLLSSEKD